MGEITVKITWDGKFQYDSSNVTEEIRDMLIWDVSNSLDLQFQVKQVTWITDRKPEIGIPVLVLQEINEDNDEYKIRISEIDETGDFVINNIVGWQPLPPVDSL